jgi:hypothetical protein
MHGTGVSEATLVHLPGVHVPVLACFACCRPWLELA